MITLIRWLVVVAAASSTVAQEPAREATPEPRPAASGEEATPAIDAAVRRSVAQVIRQGVILFNEQGDATGCYRLYQGALIGLGPMLDHRPQLQFAIDAGLDRAAELAAVDTSRAAFELRGLLDRTFEATGGGDDADRPLWDRLGGEEAVRAVVHDFVSLAANDSDVDFTRDGRFPLDAEGVARLEQLLVELISSTTGGPLKYTGRPMGPLHEGMAITDAEFNALAADLVAVLRKYEVPQAEIDELVAIVATTREDIVEVEPLWDRLGGEEAVRAVVADFVQRTAGNPEVNFTRDGRFPLDAAGVEQLKERLVQFISAATGGTLAYEGRPMKPVHEGMGITEGEFNAIAADLVASLKKFEVPQELIDELIAVVATTKGDIVETP